MPRSRRRCLYPITVAGVAGSEQARALLTEPAIDVVPMELHLGAGIDGARVDSRNSATATSRQRHIIR